MSDALRQVLRPPPDRAELPAFAGGWAGGEPFLAYAGDDAAVNWSDDLEALHEESTRGHFIDVWTRRSALEAIAPSIRPGAVVADIGCSTGYLLEDLRARQPAAVLIGADLVAAGLRKAHQNVPEAALVLADATPSAARERLRRCASVDNVLEHVPDDEASLAEMRRILRPRAVAAIVVPAAPTLFDYRPHARPRAPLARGELARKARAAGSTWSATRTWAGRSPAFWAKKKLDRRRHPNPSPQELERLVTGDITSTERPHIGRAATSLERVALSAACALRSGSATSWSSAALSRRRRAGGRSDCRQSRPSRSASATTS